MINATKREVLFIESSAGLNEAIIDSLKLASKWILNAYGLESLDLGKVNTKSYVEAIFPAYVKEFILRERGVVFSESYVRDALTLAQLTHVNCPPELYLRLTMAEGAKGKREYRKTYVPALRRGFGAFLVALHIRRAIVLPFAFKWPIGLDLSAQRKVLGRREICPPSELPELLQILRSLYSQSEEQTDDFLEGYSRRTRETLFAMGQKLIVASGWLTPEDANYEDLLALWLENDKNRFSGNDNLCCLLIADFLERKYQSRCTINAIGWRNAIVSSSASRQSASNNLFANIGSDEVVLLQQALSVIPARMSPDELAQMTSLPGLDFELPKQAKVWVAVEKAWLRKVKRESNKHRLTAIGHLNSYLFAYLPYWLAANPTFPYPFPECPNRLLGAVYVSEIGLLGHQKRPLTFVEFLEAAARNRKWGNPTHYGHLKQIEKLFEFVERIGEQMPGCAGFQQPISEHDYPNVARSYGTNKRPIPRRIFKFWINYIEAILAHTEVLLSRIVSGYVYENQLGGLSQHKATIIDCLAQQDIFGFIPVIFHEGKVIRIRYIPNLLYLNRKRLKDGRVLCIPHPHALHQILVSLYTGLRHNHIQWLDAETFDSRVDDANGESGFAQLHVNTDKSKKTAWQSYVNFRVIELLRKQLAWRSEISEAGFRNKVFYNNNPDSKWGAFYPLFSYGADGKPHNDNVYAKAWNRLLGGVQGALKEIGEPCKTLVRLLPRSVPYSDPDQAQKLFEYGKTIERTCELTLKSDITPHSARVSVVSHGISILPADIIGQYWTGQSEATVYHYVVPDENETVAEQQRQNLMLRNRGYEQGYEAMLKGSAGQTSSFIKPDEIHSKLSQSLRINIEETISAYGCVSLTLSGNSRTGVDVLRETRASGAVENKTEICPYGNQCPPEVLVALNGFRRCGPCHFAVRSIDHLPAITAKIRQVLEGLTALETELNADDGDNLTSDEWDALAKSRDVLAEDLAAWQMAGEVLEVMRQRIASGRSNKKWHIQRPEIIERHLMRSRFPTRTTDYVLARLHESEAFPSLESPQIRVKFDLLRRNLLANVGNIREALKPEQPVNPAAECLGLIRSIAAANQLGIEDLRHMLEFNEAPVVPDRKLRILPKEISC